jgi:hypothetical protein
MKAANYEQRSGGLPAFFAGAAGYDSMTGTLRFTRPTKVNGSTQIAGWVKERSDVPVNP